MPAFSLVYNPQLLALFASIHIQRSSTDRKAIMPVVCC